jgi:chromosome segregation ATPase
MAVVTKELDNADQQMGAAQSEMVQQTLIQLKAQSALISLVRKTQHLRHEELKIAHEHAGHKVTKFEALLQEKEKHLQRENGKDCDDIRAQVIHAKAKLALAAGALKACLEAKKDIQAKIDKVEELRAATQQSLDKCLETKAKLKSQLDECHHRRDSAREKLEECLARKKVLKVKIEECHAKRDEARKKLDQCLQHKKMLSEKIAKAKASLGALSLTEVEDGSTTNTTGFFGSWFGSSTSTTAEGDAIADIEEALAVLKKLNAEYDENANANFEVGSLIQSALSELEETSGEEAEVMQKLRDAASLETHNQELVMQLQTKLQDAYDDLKAIDRQSDAASAESKAAGAAADQAGAALSSLLQKL